MNINENLPYKLVSLVILPLYLLTGCATIARMDDVQIGMTNSEVLDVMGKPDAGGGSTGVWEYRLYPRSGGWSPEQYWIVMRRGYVVKYGRATALMGEQHERDGQLVYSYITLSSEEKCQNNPIEGKDVWRKYGNMSNCIKAKDQEERQLGLMLDIQNAQAESHSESTRQRRDESEANDRRMHKAFEDTNDSFRSPATPPPPPAYVPFPPPSKTRCKTKPDLFGGGVTTECETR